MTSSAIEAHRASSRDGQNVGSSAPKILTYHKVHPYGELGINTVSPSRLASHFALLDRLEFTPVDLSRIRLGLCSDQAMPARAYHVTFDDAYADFYEHALDICREHRVRPTVFVITGYVGQVNRWDCSFPRRRHLDWDALRTLAASGVSIGAHSASHPFLTRVDPARARVEIADSRKTLEDRLGAPVRAFAYPYGACSARVADLVAEAGYELAFTMDPLAVFSWGTRFSLPRMGVYAFDGTRTLSAKLGCRGHRAWRRACTVNQWIRLCAYGNLIARS